MIERKCPICREEMKLYHADLMLYDEAAAIAIWPRKSHIRRCDACGYWLPCANDGSVPGENGGNND